MFDDGAHDDALSNDGIWGAKLPAFTAGTDVRYYIEAVADDGYGTRTYDPVGAEHDVYYYQVQGNVEVHDVAATSVIVFPNPADGSCSISLPKSGENAEVSLYSINGTMVWNQLHYTSGSMINLSGIAPGCYMMQITQSNTVNNAQIIIL
jgi:hypothetical protein